MFFTRKYIQDWRRTFGCEVYVIWWMVPGNCIHKDTLWTAVVRLLPKVDILMCYGVSKYHRYGIDILFSRGVNILRPRQNGRQFPYNIFKCYFLNETPQMLINSSLEFVLKDLVNHTPAFVQIMAWDRPGDKPLSKPVMSSLLKHICVTRPQWVKQT